MHTSMGMPLSVESCCTACVLFSHTGFYARTAKRVPQKLQSFVSITSCLAHSALRLKQLPANPNPPRLTTRPLRLASTRRPHIRGGDPVAVTPSSSPAVSLCKIAHVRLDHLHTFLVPCPNRGSASHSRARAPAQAHSRNTRKDKCVSPTFTSVCLDPTRREKQQQRSYHVPYFIPVRVICRGSGMMATRAEELFVTVYSTSVSSDGVFASLRMRTQVTSRHLS